MNYPGATEGDVVFRFVVTETEPDFDLWKWHMKRQQARYTVLTQAMTKWLKHHRNRRKGLKWAALRWMNQLSQAAKELHKYSLQ